LEPAVDHIVEESAVFRLDRDGGDLPARAVEGEPLIQDHPGDMLGTVDLDLVPDHHVVPFVLERDLVTTAIERHPQGDHEATDLVDPSIGTGER
jgi:hypothetical protein